MALFDILEKKGKLKVFKTASEGATIVEGMNYVKTIVHSTKALAEKEAEKQLKNGIIKLVKYDVDRFGRQVVKKESLSLYDVVSTKNRLKVVKVKEPGETKFSEDKYVKTLKAVSKQDAENQLKVQIASGLLSHDPIENIKMQGDIETKKAIYCDFNGVLDDREKDAKVSMNEPETFRLAMVSCPHKIYKVTKLALEQNADLIMTSLWRTFHMDYNIVIARCLLHSGIEEYVNFYNENEDKIAELTVMKVTPVSESRSKEIMTHILKNGYTHYVVFEDDHHIHESLNPIMTNWNIGLLDKHIEEARDILNP